jgi:hypothetical protein
MSGLKEPPASFIAVSPEQRELRPPGPDISDSQFMSDLHKLKELRSFLIEQAVQLNPTEASKISFKGLNLLRLKPTGRSPTSEEWESLETLTHELFSHLSNPLRRRFLSSRYRGGFRGRAVQRSIHDAHGEDCTDAAEGDAMPTI